LDVDIFNQMHVEQGQAYLIMGVVKVDDKGSIDEWGI
jgi:hypothetical protein